jgi:hypothetical protein
VQGFLRVWSFGGQRFALTFSIISFRCSSVSFAFFSSPPRLPSATACLFFIAKEIMVLINVANNFPFAICITYEIVKLIVVDRRIFQISRNNSTRIQDVRFDNGAIGRSVVYQVSLVYIFAVFVFEAGVLHEHAISNVQSLSLESLVCFHQYLNAFIRDKFSNFLNQLCNFPPRSKFDFANKLFGRTHKILVGD